MNLTRTARGLLAGISELPVIDAHEHLPAEKDYLAFGYSGLNMFAGGYIWHDMESAGLDPAFKARMRDGGPRPVEQWWPIIRPYWQQVRETSFARALRIAARDIFGLDDIDDRTIHRLAEAVQTANRPGLYAEVLQRRCRIRLSITCIDRAAFPDDPGLRGITQLLKGEGPSQIAERLSALHGSPVRTLEEAAETGRELLRSEIAMGAVGFKMAAADIGAPNRVAAEEEWQAGIGSREAPGPWEAVRDYLFDRYIDVAAETDVPVAVHTGYWGDFRQLDPKHLLSFAARRQDVRFDMFHLGMPMIRDAILIGKILRNVTLNLTWCPIISQEQTTRSLDEIIDLVPLSKVTAFGGDYRVSVQKVYGHLVMAREAVAAALGRRVDAGDFDLPEAMRIARMWFHDNPARIYKLDEAAAHH
jgi:predicted TIM-barrel fold metal-dependent hydrolase